MVDRLKNFIQKEAYVFPVMICLFFVPLFYEPFFVNSFTQGKEILFKAVLLLPLIGMLIYHLLQGTFEIKRLWKSPVFAFLLAGAFFIIVSTVASPTPLIALFGTYSRGFGLFTQAFLWCFTLYCALVLNEKTVTRLLKYVFVVAVIAGLYGLLQKTGFDPLFGNFNTSVFVGRIFSFMGNPGYLGQYLLLGAIIGAYFTMETKKKSTKIIFGVSLAMLLAALWFSQTRTSVVALVICLALVAGKYRKSIASSVKKLGVKKGAAMLLTSLAAIVILVLSPQNRFSLNDESVRSLSSRFEIWKGAVSLIAEKPLFGYGEETFSIYSPQIITKQFLTLEEDLNLSIDRIHNETLETAFSYGMLAAAAYVLFFCFLLWKFLKTENVMTGLLSLIVMGNMIQNQFSFSDISICILVAFCLGAMVADELRHVREIKIPISRPLACAGIVLILAVGYLALDQTVYKPFLSQSAYAESQRNYDKNYEIAVTEHKKAILYTPDYAELWYELMFLDPSSMGRALEHIEKIEGDSGNLLAWKGNYYAESDPKLASEYYMKALEKNPYYPNWIRSYADMLYKNGDYENALSLYRVYLEAVPEFWKWKNSLDRRSQKEQTSYRIFFKNVPDFWTTVERIEELENGLEKTN